MTWRVVALIVTSCLALPAVAFGQTPIQETEPNDSPATADTAFLGGVATGHISKSTDVFDHWLLTAAAGDTIWVDMDHCWPCKDTHLQSELLAADGTTVLATSVKFDGNDEQLKYVAVTSGRYFIRVRVRLGSYDGTGVQYSLNLFPVRCPSDPTEPNNSLSAAPAIDLPFHASGRLCPADDNDFFRFEADAGTELDILTTVTGRHPEASGPHLAILDANGATLVGVGSNAPTRYVLRRGGTHYVQLYTYLGGLRTAYTVDISARATRVAPGPGDPVVTRAHVNGPDGSFLANADGGFWIVKGNVLERRLPDGNAILYNDFTTYFIARDAVGLLVANDGGVARFTPGTGLLRFITMLRISGIAVGRDGIWLTQWNIGAGGTYNRLHHYGPDGQARASYDLASLGGAELGSARITHVALGPNDEPYFAVGSAIYRLEAGHPRLMARYAAGSTIGGMVVDSAGQLYVAIVAAWGTSVTNRVVLHDSMGAIVADPFSWWPTAATAFAFGRNVDGTPNRHLFARDGTNLIELDSSAVRFPGLPDTRPLIGFARAARELLSGNAELSEPERAYLDASGNRNGRFDLGDLRALIARETASGP